MYEQKQITQFGTHPLRYTITIRAKNITLISKVKSTVTYKQIKQVTSMQIRGRCS